MSKNKELETKRRRAVFALVSAALATGFASAVPTFTVEVPKQLTLMAADVALCGVIYEIYFGDKTKLTEEKLMDLLNEATTLGFLSSVAAYAGVKITQGMFDELMDFAGPSGWLLSGSLTGSQTFVIGLVCLRICEYRYKNSAFKAN
ncbi:hypothetical protein LC653_10815 [Nostoc sp. CHAB 5784]|uniref:hypothetical protein n=1 Tax=Nostoc mirabile TaxID=2907820 RepID=UPI001E5FD88A|nr:hypothetical protein [Nostoc mirabile]MCC5664395.1 hypothetical protein [Nostoc mirabile CHAB5784]